MTNGIASGMASGIPKFMPNFIPNFIANSRVSCKAHRMAYFMTPCTSKSLPVGLTHLPHAPLNVVKP